MKLTDEEKRMLNGEHGLLKQKAMQVINRFGEVLGAERLCEVTKAHLFCGAHSYLAEGAPGKMMDQVLSEMQFCSDETVDFNQVSCYCQSDVAPMCPDSWDRMYVTEQEHQNNLSYINKAICAGVHQIGSCIPYLTGFIPLMGEHYVTSESHAVLMLNSLWGACGNSDGLEIGFCAAVCGRIPYWGNHIMENRKGTHLVKINTPLKNQMDWDLLGYTIGRFLPTHAVPVMEGFSQRPDVVKLKSCYAAMATTSGAEMCHWVGVTPEGRTLEQAFGGKKPVETIEINQKDFEDSYDFLNTTKNTTPDYISIGCPHYAIDELAFIADYLDGKKINDNVRLNVWTSPTIKDAAVRNGYAQRIEASGAILLTSSCPLTSGKMPLDTKVAAFDSAKQAHYVAPLSSAKILYSSMTDCLDAAVTGKWEGKLCQ